MACKRIAIFGAGGATGREAIRHARRFGLEVCAIDRAQPEECDRIEGVIYRTADVLKDDLAPVLNGCDAVVSTLGVAFSPSTALSPPPLYTEGTQRILDAMARHGIARIVLISAAFVTDQPHIPVWFKATVVPALHNILEQMRAMEAILEARPDLEWTAVRPGWLIDKPASGDLLVGEETLPEQAFRCRHGDLGKFLVRCVIDGSHIGGKPAVGAPEDERFENLAALGEAFTRP